MSQFSPYLLTWKQLVRRSIAVTAAATGVFAYFEIQRQYVENKSVEFSKEYSYFRTNPNHYHTLHEQVAIGLDEKAVDQIEKQMGIDKLRKKLITPHAQGLVLETCVGTNRNKNYYKDDKIVKLIGVDWIPYNIERAAQKLASPDEMTLLNNDIHKLPFNDNSFDTVVDTFGLECSYDMERAYKELKRMTKKGGKILLLERGQSLWLMDNFNLLRKASLNLAARGQVYHHNFEGLIENDPEVKVLQVKRKKKGMIYFYVLQKL